METELQKQDALIESYISFALHNRNGLKLGFDTRKLPIRGGSISDIQMQMLRNYLSDEEDWKDMEEEGCQLLEAARQDDSVSVIKLLASNPHLIWHRKNGERDTVLHVAARCGHQRTIKKLIKFIKDHRYSTFKFKSPLQEIGYNNNTPLHFAVENGHKEVASLLIKESPPDIIFARNFFRYTMPVHMAIEAGYKDLLEEMLQRAPWSSLSQSTRDELMSSSIVHNAIEARDLGLLQIVLEKMPVLIDADSHKGKPLDYAAHKGYIEEVRYILDNFPGYANNCGKNGCFPVHFAIDGNHLDIVKVIVSRYPDIMDHINRKGRKPLSYAAYLGRLDQVCYFLTNFPNYASKCDEDGSFPIHNAVAGGYVDIVKEFISRCPETMSQVNGEGLSILHLVVEYARADVLSYLKTIPEIEQIYHLRDAKGGYTFFDLVKKQMTNWEKKQKIMAE